MSLDPNKAIAGGKYERAEGLNVCADSIQLFERARRTRKIGMLNEEFDG